MSSMNLGRGLDAYSRKARLTPTLLVILPVAILAVAWSPPDRLGSATLVGLIVTLGGGIVLSEIGRDFGKARQRDLLRLWGGWPTVRLLRHRDSDANAVTRARYHAILSRVVPGMQLPTPEDEARDPIAADLVYESCIDRLRELTRDRAQFPLVFAENTSYGLRRNLWGMKTAGVASAVVGAIGSLLLSALAIARQPDRSTVPVVAALLNLCLLAFWGWRVSPAWVYQAARAYADRLLASCEALEGRSA